MRKNPNRYAVILMVLLALSACKKEESPPPPAAQPKPSAQVPKPVQKQASSATVAQNPAPQFEVSKMKDPFKPYVVEQPKQPAPSAEVRPSPDALPIESYDLGKFRVVGIIVGMKENSALVIDPAGKGYVVKKGMTIGSNRGVIMRITASAVEVDERYVEESGRKKRRTVRLTLPQKR